MVQQQNDFEQLDPNLIRAERLSSLLFFSVLSFGAVVGWIAFAFLGWGLRDYRTWAILLLGSLLLAALGWWFYRYPLLRWQMTKLKESDRGLELHRGIYWQHKIFIPRERIQHTDIIQGPISRKFQIADLVINTAGNHNYEIRIEGLNESRAKTLRLNLLPRVRDHKSSEIQSRESSADSEACSIAGHNSIAEDTEPTRLEPAEPGMNADAVKPQSDRTLIDEGATIERQKQ